MDYSAANASLWNVIIQLGLIAGAILVANMLRNRVQVIRKAMMPYRRDTEDGHRVQMKLSFFMRQALKGNIAAAIISVGILFLQALIAMSFIIWLR